MKVKELIEELKKYPEDTEVFTEMLDSEFGVTHIYDPDVYFKEEIRYDKDERGRLSYASYLKCDGIMNNVLIIS